VEKLKLCLIIAILTLLSQPSLALDSTGAVCRSLFGFETEEQKPNVISKEQALARDFSNWASRVPRDATLLIPQHSLAMAIMQKQHSFVIEIRFFRDGQLNSQKYKTRYEIPGRFEHWQNSKSKTSSEDTIIVTDDSIIHFSPLEGIKKRIFFHELKTIPHPEDIVGVGTTNHMTKVFLGYRKSVAVLDLESGKITEQFNTDIARPKFGVSQSGDYVIYGQNSTGTEIEVVNAQSGLVQSVTVPENISAITTNGPRLAYADITGGVFVLDLNTGAKTRLDVQLDTKDPLQRVFSLIFKKDFRSNHSYYLEIKSRIGKSLFIDVSQLFPN